jgi:hypothetical protein
MFFVGRLTPFILCHAIFLVWDQQAAGALFPEGCFSLPRFVEDRERSAAKEKAAERSRYVPGSAFQDVRTVTHTNWSGELEQETAASSEKQISMITSKSLAL